MVDQPNRFIARVIILSIANASLGVKQVWFAAKATLYALLTQTINALFVWVFVNLEPVDMRITSCN